MELEARVRQEMIRRNVAAMRPIFQGGRFQTFLELFDYNFVKHFSSVLEKSQFTPHMKPGELYKWGDPLYELLKDPSWQDDFLTNRASIILQSARDAQIQINKELDKYISLNIPKKEKYLAHYQKAAQEFVKLLGEQDELIPQLASYASINGSELVLPEESQRQVIRGHFQSVRKYIQFALALEHAHQNILVQPDGFYHATAQYFHNAPEGLFQVLSRVIFLKAFHQYGLLDEYIIREAKRIYKLPEAVARQSSQHMH